MLGPMSTSAALDRALAALDALRARFEGLIEPKTAEYHGRIE